MDEGQFNYAMVGDGATRVLHDGRCDRLRYHIVAALDDYAAEKQREGRRDRAMLLRYISGQLRTGSTPSKKSLGKAKPELAEIRRRIVGEYSPICEEATA